MTKKEVDAVQKLLLNFLDPAHQRFAITNRSLVTLVNIIASRLRSCPSDESRGAELKKLAELAAEARDRGLENARAKGSMIQFGKNPPVPLLREEDSNPIVACPNHPGF